MNETWLPLCSSIHDAQSILLISHIFPDGDTCGSALALRRALLSLGKDVACCCEHSVPDIYTMLDGADTIVHPDALAGRAFDLAISIDVADEGRMGSGCAALFAAARRTAQIDHHGTNPCYADTNVIRSPLSATGVLVTELLDALEVPFDRKIAECLYVAVATDTGNFKQANADAAAFSVAARCIGCGFDIAAISRRVFDLKPVCQVKLFGVALSSLQTSHGGEVATAVVSREDFERCGAKPEHTEGIVNIVFNMEQVKIAALLVEKGEGVKVSLRSVAPYDVAEVSRQFGGGGHAMAAGCTMQTDLEEARRAIAAACEAIL